MSSYTRQQLEEWLGIIKIGAMRRVLDVGGAQKPVKPRLGHSGEGSTYTILDLPEPHETKEKATQIMDLNEPYLDEDTKKSLEEVEKKILGYDIVFCLEVMEYIWNPYEAVKNIYLLTKNGGKMYMSVPFIYPVHNPKHNDYLRYTDMGISRLLENAGFEVNKLIPRVARNYEILRGFYDAEGMKASRDYGSHDVVGWLIEATRL